MVRTRRTAVGLAVVLAAVFAASSGCKRGSSANRQMMKTLAGTWVWRAPGRAYTTVVVLELTHKGRYKETTYAEIRGKRKLLYFNRFQADFRVEPDDPKAIEALKKQRFEPAVETGRYILGGEPGQTTITFASDTRTTAETAEGAAKTDQPLTLMQGNQQLRIGSKTYIRQIPAKTK